MHNYPDDPMKGADDPRSPFNDGDTLEEEMQRVMESAEYQDIFDTDTDRLMELLNAFHIEANATTISELHAGLNDLLKAHIQLQK